VLYPKPTSHPHYLALLKQLAAARIPVVDPSLAAAFDALAVRPGEEPATRPVVVDAVFGFSFRVKEGVAPEEAVREPYAGILKEMAGHAESMLCVDIPSGWDVDRGNVLGCASVGPNPAALISLTLPKAFARETLGADTVHYVGGRFVPPTLAEELKLNIPLYKGTDQIVKLRR